MRGHWSSWFAVSLCVVLAAAPAECVVGGAPASAPEPDAAVVFTQRHGRSARIEGIKDNRLGYYSFFGIRYAEPPLGPRRFQRPERRMLAGEQNATRPCFKCPQPDPQSPQQMIGHEDCLCLNLFSPKMPGEERGSPVIFFVHGGNYRSGSASPYGGKHLTQQDTILVVPQYRLGSLGFITNGRREATGNAGLFDLHVALAWVKDYIEFFGGDPTRVTVMGQGSGGGAASLLALSPEGRNGNGVVALSGTPLSPGAVRKDPAKHTQELAKRTDCPASPIEMLVNCLRKQPVEKIVKADSGITSNMVDTTQFLNDITGRSGAGARVDGQDDKRGLPTLVVEQPAETLKKKKQTLPLLTGVNSAETTKAVFGKYSNTLTSSLQQINDFIKKDIIGGLTGVVEGVEGLLPIKKAELRNIPLLGNFEEYYNRLAQNGADAVQGLSAIAEVTADALFNFPAFKTVQEWVGAPAYLYSFEFAGNLTKAAHFLPGVPLAEDPSPGSSINKAKKKGPSHGDELAYIFEPLNDDGMSVEGEASQVDRLVRRNFIGLISKFSHDLNFDARNGSNSQFTFNKNKNAFIKIKEQITSDQDFRFCQMGLWGNMVDRLTGTLCQNQIGNLLKLVPIPTELNPVSLLNPVVTNLNPAQGLLPKKPPAAQDLLPSVTKWLSKK